MQTILASYLNAKYWMLTELRLITYSTYFDSHIVPAGEL